jgi:hypothetical protein
MQVKRTKGKRRWSLFPEFPLRDGSGVVVFSDRRRHSSDRRLENTSLEDRLLMLAEMPPPGHGNTHNP